MDTSAANPLAALTKAGLYAPELAPVDTPEIVARYNACLQAAGLQPTALTEFRVDCVGWSPEVAEERGSRHYLSLGDGNRAVIIVTPDQSGKPVCHPLFSFEARLMAQYFERFAQEIARVTSEAGIWLDLDPGISSFQSPEDLLLIGNVTVRTYCTTDLMDTARRQAELVDRFLNENNAWSSAALRLELVDTASRHGDLRNQPVVIPDMVFTDTAFFHARAFGGVFVLRDIERNESIIVVEDHARKSAFSHDRFTELWDVGDARLPARLHELGLLDIDFDWYSREIPALERLCEAMLAEVVWSECETAEFEKYTVTQRKTCISRLRSRIPQAFFELERLILRLERPGLVRVEEVSPELRRHLYHPGLDLPEPLRRVLWQLLCRISGYDVVRIHRHDLDTFVTRFAAWPEARRRWAVSVLRKAGHRKADR